MAIAAIVLIGILLAIGIAIYFMATRKAEKPDHFDDYLAKLLNLDDDWKP